MKKILVLGSKPGASISKFDEAYCANAAASYYNDDLCRFEGRITSIVSASELVESQRLNINKSIWLEDKFQRIINSNMNRLIIVGAEYFPNVKKRIFDNITKEVEIIFLKNFFFEEILYEYLNISSPIITNSHFGDSLFEILKILKLFFKEYYKKKIDSNYLVHSLFRQGTGINSLLFAIQENKKKSSMFRVSGIGFTNRDRYPDGSVNTWTPKNRVNKNHVFVDRYLIKRLNKLFNITYDKNTFF